MGVLPYDVGHFEIFQGYFGYVSLVLVNYTIFFHDILQMYLFLIILSRSQNLKKYGMLAFATGCFEDTWERFGVYISISCELFNIFFTKFCTNILANTLIVKERRNNFGSCILFEAIFWHCYSHFGCIPSYQEKLKVFLYVVQNFLVLLWWLEGLGMFLLHFEVCSSSGKELFNSFEYNLNIYVTCETVYNFELAFLDVILCRDGENLLTTVYRKVTNGYVYLNWNSFAPHN